MTPDTNTEEKNNRGILYITGIIFTILTVIHIIYATITNRGLYEDGAFYAISMLNNLADNVYKTVYDPGHPRFIMLFLMQFPAWILNFIHINDKNSLLYCFSFSQFILPFAFLIFDFLLTKRTKRQDIFFWHLFVYCIVMIPFSIFSVVESLPGIGMHFILWNYLVSDIDYKKRDIIFIIFFIICMFSTYEYVVFLGFIIFIFHFLYVMKATGIKQQAVKTFIGVASLCSGLYNIIFMLNADGESDEISRFLGEALNYMPHILELCSLYSVIAIILMVLYFLIKKEELDKYFLFIIASFIYAGIKLYNSPELSVYPMWEQHIRTVPCFLLPVIFIIMPLRDIFFKEINIKRYKTLICIALICGIFQTAHQIRETYWWQKNINYMKTELADCDSLLYIPSEHEELSGFHNNELRRFIWHGVFPATGILFSDEKEQKTFLMTYDYQVDDGNPTGREYLYYTEDDKLSIPFGARLNLENKFWDITECAKAIEKYNKENNIRTYADE